MPHENIYAVEGVWHVIAEPGWLSVSQVNGKHCHTVTRVLLECDLEPNVLVFTLTVHHWFWWFVFTRRWCCQIDDPSMCGACICSGAVAAALQMIMLSLYPMPSEVDS